MEFVTAIRIAQEFAALHDLNDVKVEAAAESWADAGRDYDKDTEDELLAFLRRRFLSGEL